MFTIYPIVEGHGEVRAVPILIRRIATELYSRHDVQVLQGHRLARGRMIADQSRALRNAVELGVRKIRDTGEPGAILVQLDADDECPANLGPALLGEIGRPDIATSVVVANREFEAWFLAGAESLRAHRMVLTSAVAPDDPEVIRNAKQYLESRILRPGASYQETVDQPALSAVLNIQQARAAPSFDKLCRDLDRLLKSTQPTGP